MVCSVQLIALIYQNKDQFDCRLIRSKETSVEVEMSQIEVAA